jgi:hypothetical protein
MYIYTYVHVYIYIYIFIFKYLFLYTYILKHKNIPKLGRLIEETAGLGAKRGLGEEETLENCLLGLLDCLIFAGVGVFKPFLDDKGDPSSTFNGFLTTLTSFSFSGSFLPSLYIYIYVYIYT